MDWKALRERIQNAKGCATPTALHRSDGDDRKYHRGSASIEPTFQNLFVKSNLSGEFTVSTNISSPTSRNSASGRVMWPISILRRQPRPHRPPYRPICVACTPPPFEVEPVWVVEAGARRQKWSTSPSVNIYIGQASGKKRTKATSSPGSGAENHLLPARHGATHAEKSTVRPVN